MPLFDHFVSWATVHWGLFSLACTTVGTAVGGAVVWLLNRSRDRAQTRLANAQREVIEEQREATKEQRKQAEQAKFNHHISSLAGRVLMWMDMEKKRLGAVSVLISEDNLIALLESDADKLPLVMNYLMGKGKAKHGPSGSWILK